MAHNQPLVNPNDNQLNVNEPGPVQNANNLRGNNQEVGWIVANYEAFKSFLRWILEFWIWGLVFILVLLGEGTRIYFWVSEVDENVIDWIRLIFLLIFFVVICGYEYSKYSPIEGNIFVSIHDYNYPPFGARLGVEAFQEVDPEQQLTGAIQEIFNNTSFLIWKINPIAFWTTLQSAAFGGVYVLIWWRYGCEGRFWTPLIAGAAIKVPLIYVITSVFVKYAIILRWREKLGTGIYKYCKGHPETLEVWYRMRRRIMDFLEEEFSQLADQIKIIVAFYGIRTITVVLDALLYPEKDTCDDDVIQFWIFNAATWAIQFAYLIWIMYLESYLDKTYSRDIYFLTKKANEVSGVENIRNLQAYSCMAQVLDNEEKHNPLSRKLNFLLKLIAFSGFIVPVAKYLYTYHFG